MNDENIDSLLNDIETADNGFINDIRKYWKIITSFDDFEEMITAPLVAVKKTMPEVPEEEWDDFIKEYNIPAIEGEHLNLIMKHFTHEEIKGIIDLYENHPLLKKSIKKSIIIRDESFELTRKDVNTFQDLLMDKIVKWRDMGYIE